MVTAICITIIVLHLLVVSFIVRADIVIDVFSNDGYLKLYVFGIRLFKLSLYIHQLDRLHNNLVVMSRRRKKEYHINANANDEKSIARWFKGFVPYFNILYIGTDVRLGKRDDAMQTTLILAGIRLILQSLLAYLRSREHIIIESDFSCDYNRDVIYAKIDGIIDVTIADIIYSFLAHLLKRIKKKRQRDERDPAKLRRKVL